VEISFNLSIEPLRTFALEYDFAWAKRQFNLDVERLRALILRSVEKGWSIAKLGQGIQDDLNLDLEFARMLAATETVRAANAGAITTYRRSGIARKAWVPCGEACGYCRGLARKAVGIDEPFLAAGQVYLPRKNMHPLIVVEPVYYPPLHGACRCAIRAEVG
jgi:hypothetical protein